MPTRRTTWNDSAVLTVLRVRTTYSPIIESSAMMKPANSDSSTMIDVQPGTPLAVTSARVTRKPPSRKLSPEIAKPSSAAARSGHEL